MSRTCSILLLALLCHAAYAADDDATQKAKEQMQRSLNERVMAAPFDPGDIKKADAYAESAKKAGVKPVPAPPGYWVPGWTCTNLIAYPAYVYSDYRNCIYFHYYYGRFWP